MSPQVTASPDATGCWANMRSATCGVAVGAPTGPAQIEEVRP